MNEKLEKFNFGNDLENYDEIFENIADKINEAVNIILYNKHFITIDDFKVYHYDEYMLNTNNDIYAPINFYVCLNNKLNIKRISTKYNNTVAPSLHYELHNFREELYNVLIELFDERFMLTKDKYGIKISSNEYCKKFNMVGINYYIRPCIAYKNENNVEGVLFYTNNRKYIDIDYPTLAMDNFISKDERTNYLLSTYIKIFKNMYMKYYKVEDTPFEMFEVLFYNVPDEYYKDISFDTAKGILEYLINKELITLKTIDEQDYQFNSKYKSLSKLYAQRLIRTMYKLVCNPDHKIFR